MKKLLFLFFMVSEVCFGQLTEGQYEEYITYKVSATSGLNLREFPNLKSKKVITLPFGQEVFLESKTGIKLTINDRDKVTGVSTQIEGEWIKVVAYKTEAYDDTIALHRLASSTIYYLEDDLFYGTKKDPRVKLFFEGYVFDGFLEKQSQNLKKGRWTYYFESGAVAKTEDYIIARAKNPHDDSPIVYSYPKQIIKYDEDGITVLKEREEAKTVLQYPDGSFGISSEIEENTFYKSGKIQCTKQHGHFDYFEQCWEENKVLKNELSDLYNDYLKNLIQSNTDSNNCCFFGQVRPGDNDYFQGPRGVFLYQSNLYEGIKKVLLSRNIEAIKKDFYDITFMEQLSMLKIFKSHKTDLGVWENRNKFSQYNPKFINWMKDNLIPQPDFIIDEKYAQHWFQYFKRFFRLMVESYYYTTKVIDFEYNQSAYISSASSMDFNGLIYLGSKYSGNIKGYEIPATSEVWFPFEDYMAIGFWLRRGIDNTHDEFFELLSSIMNQYDKNWFDSIKARYQV